MLFKCEVFNKEMGWDEYLVSAKSKKEATKKCRERLDEETDDPKNWEIVYVEIYEREV